MGADRAVAAWALPDHSEGPVTRPAADEAALATLVSLRRTDRWTLDDTL